MFKQANPNPLPCGIVGEPSHKRDNCRALRKDHKKARKKNILHPKNRPSNRKFEKYHNSSNLPRILEGGKEEENTAGKGKNAKNQREKKEQNLRPLEEKSRMVHPTEYHKAQEKKNSPLNC